MKLVVFHYHLRPGGVTGVITQACIAVGKHLPEVTEILLVAGSEDNAEDILARIRAAAPASVVSFRVHPELRYRSEQNGVAAEELERRIATLLRREYLGDDVVWWVHNYHIGKNPPFTAALLTVLTEEPDLPAVLQIHDFPECASFENLRTLREHLSGRVYPSASNIAYATINYRDRRLLLEAGIPESHVTALPNPVAVVPGRPTARTSEKTGREAPGSATGTAEVLTRLGQASGARFPGFHREGHLFVYPVRAIRRKNVFEAGFLARLLALHAERPVNLVVTLPGTSPPEKPYSDMVDAAFAAGILPGMSGVGTRLEEAGVGFEEFMQAAEVILSTSVQEGFGYAFFEAPLWGAPLAARYLDILDGLDHLFEGYPHTFYRRLLVPFESPSIDSIRGILRVRYAEQLDRAGAMPEAARRHVEEEIEELLSGDTVDFSFLMPQMQYAYTKDLADEGFANEVGSLNLELTASVLRLLDGTGAVDAPHAEAEPSGSRPMRNGTRKAVAGELGHERYAARVSALLSQLERRVAQGTDRLEAPGDTAGRTSASGAGEAGDDPIQQQLVAAFAHLDYFRLLYGRVGE
ncbi:MAG: hypothetical protein ACLFS5_03970 [Spirochaetaceae bacterium]